MAMTGAALSLTMRAAVGDALAPYKTPEELIRRIAPFAPMGNVLCKQKNGPNVPGGEL